MAVIIPKRLSREPVPRFNAPISRYSGGMGAAMDQLGEAFQKHSDRIQLQHDVSTSQTAVRDFRDLARTELGEHKSREGANAVGSLRDYQKWFDEESTKTENTLENDTQRQRFRNDVDQTRGSDLDVLATHQAKEHKRNGLANLKSQSVSAEREVTANAHPNTIDAQMLILEESYRVVRPGVDNSEDLAAERVKLEVIALNTLMVIDPEKAKILVDEWREDLGEQYEKARSMVMREYLHQTAKQKFPGDFDAQYDYIKNYPDVPENVRSYAQSRVNALEAETAKREQVEYTELYQGTQDGVSAMVRAGNFDNAMTIISSTSNLRETDKLNLENVVRANMNGEVDPFSVSDPEFLQDQINLAVGGKLDPELIVAIPNKLSRTDANMVRGISTRMRTEYRGEAKPQEINARKAVQKIIEDMNLGKREETLMIGNKLNEFNEYARKNPGTDFMGYVDKTLLAEEKGWAISRWLDSAWNSAVDNFPAVRINKFVQDLFDEEVLEQTDRERATEILQDGGHPITDRNIQFVIDSPEFGDINAD